MIKLALALSLGFFSQLATAQDYTLLRPDTKRLQPPRVDMSPAVFAGHTAFLDILGSVQSMELNDSSQGIEKIELKLGELRSMDFFPIRTTPNVFKTDISGTPLTAYPDARLLLSYDKPRPFPNQSYNPVATIRIYLVGKYPFASWGYGDVESPLIVSKERWLQTSLKSLGTRRDEISCDPRFPCDPRTQYLYEAEFRNSDTDETRTENYILDYRL